MQTDGILFGLPMQAGKARKSRRFEVTSDGNLSSSDGGLLLLAEIERRRGSQ